jgi:7-carboxy-7-deazaguanine synthase
MIVNEIFHSLQGEGFLTGVPSAFIRLAGCPLRCKWCDTKYALDPNAGDDLTIEQIIDKVETITSLSSHEPRATSHESRYIVITGGEPMTNPDLPKLAQALKNCKKHITIETAGIAFVPKLPCDLMSISPKLSNSGSGAKLDLAVLNDLIAGYDYQLKFVVDSADDLPEIKQVLSKLNNVDFSKVMLMPQAATRDELLAKSPMVADLCKQSGFTFCQRLQVLLWDNKRGF